MRSVSTLDLPGTCAIEFLAQGAFNKVYIVRSLEVEVVVRVTLPVDPAWKTLSEVATLKWVRENTSLPVPEVLAYRADRSSTIGFEWIIMNKIPGKPLAEVWGDISFSAKETIVRQLALFCSNTFQKQMHGIGNLFPRQTLKTPCVKLASASHLQYPCPFHVQKIVSAAFIWDNRIHQDVFRGPFTSSKDWLFARLMLVDNDYRSRLNRIQNITNSDDEEEEEEYEVEELEHIMDIILRLKSRLDEFFPTKNSQPEPSMIFHDDLSRSNILVDQDGVLTAVVDWECVSALPLWFACQFPPLLQGKLLDKEPIESKYQHDVNGEFCGLAREDRQRITVE
ncbi:hypothetical protein B7463_g3395, partial [Scytalidium lignicola]